jgi:hypothetical protein
MITPRILLAEALCIEPDDVEAEYKSIPGKAMEVFAYSDLLDARVVGALDRSRGNTFFVLDDAIRRGAVEAKRLFSLPAHAHRDDEFWADLSFAVLATVLGDVRVEQDKGKPGQATAATSYPSCFKRACETCPFAAECEAGRLEKMAAALMGW